MKGTDESSVALTSVNEFIIFFSEHIHGKGEGHGLGALEVGDKSGHLLLGQDEGNSAPGHLVGVPHEEWTSDQILVSCRKSRLLLRFYPKTPS